MNMVKINSFRIEGQGLLPMFPWAIDRQADDFTGLHATTLVVTLFTLKVAKRSITKTTPTLREIYNIHHNKVHTHTATRHLNTTRLRLLIYLQLTNTLICNEIL